jgi:hypothetical protein
VECLRENNGRWFAGIEMLIAISDLNFEIFVSNSCRKLGIIWIVTLQLLTHTWKRKILWQIS